MARRCLSVLCLLLLAAYALQTRAAAAPLLSEALFPLGDLKEGEHYTFRISLSNVSGQDLEIVEIEPSCGCVDIKDFSRQIKAGAAGYVALTIDTTGKIGKIVKFLDIRTSGGASHALKLTGLVKHEGEGGVDASAIFRGACRKCHVGDAVHFTSGRELYDSLCYICHKDKYPGAGLATEGLRDVISHGRRGTSMPGFLTVDGGPLTAQQVDLLVDHLKGIKSPGQ